MLGNFFSFLKDCGEPLKEFRQRSTIIRFQFYKKNSESSKNGFCFVLVLREEILASRRTVKRLLQQSTHDKEDYKKVVMIET